MTPDTPTLACPEAVRRLWGSLARLDSPATRGALAQALPPHEGPDARCLAALVACMGGDDDAVEVLVETGPRLSGALDGPPAPWPQLLVHGLPRLPEPARSRLAQALLPRVREDVVARTRCWVQDPVSVDIARLRQVVGASVPEVATAAARAMSSVSAEATSAGLASPEDQRIRALIDEYDRLAADFANGHPRAGDPDTSAARLVEVQRTLNAHWLASPSLLWSVLAEQGRFLSSGSAGVCAWLRNHRRYDEAVAHVGEEMADLSLCRMRQLTSPAAFEAFFNNGLGSFLDSGDPEHIELGVALLDRLEEELQPFVGGDALYQAACLLARDGQVERALVYVHKAVHAGESAREMARDPDLASVHQDQRFLRLLEQAGVRRGPAP